MTREELILGIQARMGDLNDGEQVEVATNPFVDNLMEDAVEGYLMLLPTYLLPITSFTSNNTITITGSEVTAKRIALPEGFIKLMDFQTDTWYKPATVTLEGTPTYLRQLHKYSFGGNSRPVVTIVNDNTLGKAIEYYYVTTTAPTVTVANCVIKEAPEDLPEDILDGYMWYVASVCFEALELPNNSKSALERVKMAIRYV